MSRLSRIRQLFDDCLDRPLAERDAYLADAVGGDDELLNEVRSLLAAHLLVEASDPIGAVIERGSDALKPREPLPELERGRKLDDFVIIRKLGSGGAGDVYLASQLSLGRNVALKISRADSPEARTMARLKHGNIVQVYATMRLEEINATAICMQYVPGVTLADVLDFVADNREWSSGAILSFIEHAQPNEVPYGFLDSSVRTSFAGLNQVEVIRHLAIAVGRALSYAHSMNVLHLDVKPSNILIDLNGEALLTDFNVSLRQDRPGEAMLGGTPDYMAPEHMGIVTGTTSEADLDGRADLYSLGIVMRKMMACVMRREEALDFEQIVAICTKEERNERFRNAADFVGKCEQSRKLRILERNLEQEQDWFLYRFGRKFPKTAIVAALIIPNLIASLFQIFYNQIHIMGPLTEKQRNTFVEMLLPWNTLIFSISFFLIWFFFRNVFKISPSFYRKTQPLSRADRDAARLALRKIPLLSVVIIALSWSVACLLFMFGLPIMAGELAPEVKYHFLVSFFMAMAIPLAFCFLAIVYLNIAVFYPLLLDDVKNLESTVKNETCGLRQAMKGFRFLAGAIPLVGAVIAVMQGPGIGEGRDYPFQTLVVAFIVNGVAGMIFAVSVVDRFNAAMARLDEACG